MITSFRNTLTKELFFQGKYPYLPANVAKRAKKQLDRLHVTMRIEDLYFPPSNRMERLGGTSSRRYSIRVNRQYRITFEWNGGDAENVKFEDYH